MMVEIERDMQVGYVATKEIQATATTQSKQKIDVIVRKQPDGSLLIKDQNGNVFENLDLNKIRKIEINPTVDEMVDEAVTFCKSNHIKLTMRNIAKHSGLALGTIHKYRHLFKKV
jgi:hypothetical protein